MHIHLLNKHHHQQQHQIQYGLINFGNFALNHVNGNVVANFKCRRQPTSIYHY